MGTTSGNLNSATVNLGKRPAIKVFVATTVMLSFISFWRAAAIVLCDLASSAYYVGGDAENVIGKSAPWFVLAVMLFSYAVRSLYIESSSMFVRGGVYRVVKEAMGGTLAKLSVSALLFDYVLTGPISAVSAGSTWQDSWRIFPPGSATRSTWRAGVATISPPHSALLSSRISGGKTSKACTSRARRRCASCKSPR